jgi:hypothetical protein
VEWVCKADAAQRRRDERAANKGRGLKIGNGTRGRGASRRPGIGKLTVEGVQRIENRVNNHPCRILGYKTTNEAAA